jgi:curved DNA-binding protein CbpA
MNKYYRTLGIEYDAPLSEVRRAYRDMVLVWHPDRFANNERLHKQATEKLVEINEAYRMLRTISVNDLDEKEGEPLAPADEPIDWTPVSRRASSPFSAERRMPRNDDVHRSSFSFDTFRGKGYYFLLALVVLWLAVMTLLTRY